MLEYNFKLSTQAQIPITNTRHLIVCGFADHWIKSLLDLTEQSTKNGKTWLAKNKTLLNKTRFRGFWQALAIWNLEKVYQITISSWMPRWCFNVTYQIIFHTFSSLSPYETLSLFNHFHWREKVPFITLTLVTITNIKSHSFDVIFLRKEVNSKRNHICKELSQSICKIILHFTEGYS